MAMGFAMSLVWLPLAVRAPRAAGLGATSQRLVDDLLDGAGAPAAFGTAAEAAIDLPGGAGKRIRSRNCGADVVVAQDVAGTNNHENKASPRLVWRHEY
jgi:hypothetical protein